MGIRDRDAQEAINLREQLRRRDAEYFALLKEQSRLISEVKLLQKELTNTNKLEKLQALSGILNGPHCKDDPEIRSQLQDLMIEHLTQTSNALGLTEEG